MFVSAMELPCAHLEYASNAAIDKGCAQKDMDGEILDNCTLGPYKEVRRSYICMIPSMCMACFIPVRKL